MSVSSILSQQVGVIPVLCDPTVHHESDLVTPMQKLKVKDFPYIHVVSQYYVLYVVVMYYSITLISSGQNDWSPKQAQLEVVLNFERYNYAREPEVPEVSTAMQLVSLVWFMKVAPQLFFRAIRQKQKQAAYMYSK